MENLPSINEILENQYFQVGMIVWVVFFSGCITRMVPDNLRRLLDHPVVKVGVLALVVYLAEKDFKLAVVVAAGFFLSTAPLDVKEGMAVPNDCNQEENLNTNFLGLVTGCKKNECEFVPADILNGTAAYCEAKCSSGTSSNDCGSIGNNKCEWDSNNNTCQNNCSTFDETNCPSGRCAVYQIDGNNKCEKPCGQYNKNNCPKDGVNAHCKIDNDNCVDK